MSILQSWNQSFSWKQCVVLRHLDSSRTLQLTEHFFPPLFRFWWFRPTAGNVFPTAGSFPPALWLIFGSHGSSKVVSPPANSSNDPSGTDELDLQQQWNSFHLSIHLHPNHLSISHPKKLRKTEQRQRWKLLQRLIFLLRAHWVQPWCLNFAPPKKTDQTC